MRRTWTGKAAGYLLAAILGVFAGLYIVITMPYAWMYGTLTLMVSIVFLCLSIRNREETIEGHEKPLMDVATSFDDENDE